MTEPLVTEKFKLPGLDNYSLRQQNKFGDDITREELLNNLNKKLDIIITLLRKNIE